MTSKVFLFDSNCWLYCSDVTYHKGVWTGWVENGNWFMYFDQNTNVLESYESYKDKINGRTPVSSSKVKLIWASDTIEFGYRSVILDAQERYLSGEEPNYILIDKKKKTETRDKDEVSF
jgi:hypothetical protein